jgi:glycosyltransferase involved in cell wall biosynthesis
MRIAYICMDFGVPVLGRKGCSIHVQEVVRALSRLGAQVELFATRVEGDLPSEWETVHIHQVPVRSLGDRSQREQAALDANHHLTAALQYEGPFDLVYERYSLWSYAGIEYARMAEAPALLEVNAPLIEEQARFRGLANRSAAERVAHRVFSAATSLIAVSEEVAAYLQRFPGTADRIHVVPNGVDPDRFSPGVPPSRPGEPGTFTIGFAGSLKPWHGLSVLIEAFAQVASAGSGDPRTARAPARLLIVGDGPERNKLIEDLTHRGLRESAYFTGAVPAGEMPGLLASMDLAVAPYPPLPDFYFSPLKIFEYMAAGLPIVASRVGQVARLIQDEVNGVLCRPGDPMALAAAIDRVRNDPALRQRLGQAARQTVLRVHTWEHVAKRILCLAGLVGTNPVQQVADQTDPLKRVTTSLVAGKGVSG